MNQKKNSSESYIVQKIVTRLKQYEDSFVFKVHGGMYQRAGIPDLLFWYKGKAFAFEVKKPEGKYGATPLQLKTIQKLRRAGVHAVIVTSVEETDRFIENTLL